MSGLSRHLPRFLAGGVLLVIAACASAPAADAPLNRDSLRVLRWIAPDADQVRAMTTRPTACRDRQEEVVISYRENDAAWGYTSIDFGRIAFESPALLGGAAGRMGLSCASCHINGRDNPDFFVEGVSAAPGTADVTNSLFSKTRGNGAFDPAPIPDIAARDGKQIKDRRGPEFRAKVHGLIAAEFDGQEPDGAILDAVIAYMDGLIPCPDPAAREPVTASMDIDAAQQAFWIAQDTQGAGRRLMSRAARERLERLNERFVAADQDDVRAVLFDVSKAIGIWMEAPSAEGESAIQAALKTTAERVMRKEPRSLYNPDVLRAALER